MEGDKRDIAISVDLESSMFEPGSAFVEYRRPEAACMAAHCLHGRIFDGRVVTVGYVGKDLYQMRFHNREILYLDLLHQKTQTKPFIVQPVGKRVESLTEEEKNERKELVPHGLVLLACSPFVQCLQELEPTNVPKMHNEPLELEEFFCRNGEPSSETFIPSKLSPIFEVATCNFNRYKPKGLVKLRTYSAYSS
ncbi:hypothetical protein OROMI_000508 [Orobanche minor]